jgi:hypothetical protein
MRVFFWGWGAICLEHMHSKLSLYIAELYCAKTLPASAIANFHFANGAKTENEVNFVGIRKTPKKGNIEQNKHQEK